MESLFNSLENAISLVKNVGRPGFENIYESNDPERQVEIDKDIQIIQQNIKIMKEELKSRSFRTSEELRKRVKNDTKRKKYKHI
jgi:CHASE3 domain sensor protein